MSCSWFWKTYVIVTQLLPHLGSFWIDWSSTYCLVIYQNPDPPLFLYNRLWEMGEWLFRPLVGAMGPRSPTWLETRDWNLEGVWSPCTHRFTNLRFSGEKWSSQRIFSGTWDLSLFRVLFFFLSRHGTLQRTPRAGWECFTPAPYVTKGYGSVKPPPGHARPLPLAVTGLLSIWYIMGILFSAVILDLLLEKQPFF